MCVYECVHIHAVSVNAKGMPPPGAEVTDGGGLPKVGWVRAGNQTLVLRRTTVNPGGIPLTPCFVLFWKQGLILQVRLAWNYVVQVNLKFTSSLLSAGVQA